MKNCCIKISLLTLLTTVFWAFNSSAQAEPVIKEPQTKELDEVVVSSSPLPKSIFDLAQSVTALDKEQIQETAQPSLGETLSSQPGVTSTFYGQGASRPVIRGQSGDRVRIMQNGIGIQDVSNASPDHAVALEPIQSDRIEVVRGAATLLFGPNAIGGVVNVLDNRIPEEMPEKPLSGAVDLRAGTVDALRSFGAKIDAPVSENIAVHLDGFYRKSDNYSIPGFARSAALRSQGLPEGLAEEPKNKRPDSFAEAEGATIGTSYIFEKGFIGIAGNLFNTTYGLPGAEQNVSLNLQQRRLDLRGRVDDAAPFIKRIESKTGIVDYLHKELDGAELGTLFKNQGIDTRLELTHNPVGRLEGIFGVQYQYSDFAAVGEEAFITPTKTNVYSGFGFEELDAGDGLSFQAGGRIDSTDTQTIGYKQPGSDSENGQSLSDSKVALSAALSTVYKFADQYSTALSFTHTERAPAGTELYANGPHVGTVAFEVGDPDIGMERAFGVDLNLRKRSGYVTGFVSGFYNRFNNYISLDPTGEIADDLPIYNFEGFQADFFGAESQVAFHLFGPKEDSDGSTKATKLVGKEDSNDNQSDRNHLDLIGQFDFVRAYDREGKGNLPRIPPWRLLFATDYQREAFGARAEVQHVFSQDLVASYESQTDGYTLVNLILTHDISMDTIPATIFLRANNIFDEEARSNLSFLKDLTPLPGRNLMAGMRFTF